MKNEKKERIFPEFEISDERIPECKKYLGCSNSNIRDCQNCQHFEYCSYCEKKINNTSIILYSRLIWKKYKIILPLLCCACYISL